MIDTAVNQKIDQDLQQHWLNHQANCRAFSECFDFHPVYFNPQSAQLPGVRMEKVLAAVNAARRQVTGKREISNSSLFKTQRFLWGPGTNAQVVSWKPTA